MKSFRTEVENNVVEQDILDLANKIDLFRHGKMDEEKFRSLRLARGVYGQRQLGVQMIRIKIPFGHLNARKLLRICDVSEEYSRGRLHVTTRQDFQIHHVSLDRTPELWQELEKDEITLREACGNTVRNITASSTAGIDPDEPFDPRPYAEATFQYFLRNPICQEMGRKFKMSFSNTKADTALAFMHDLGFIAETKIVDGEAIHGFQVWLAGGLGSQSQHAHLLSDFTPADEIIPLAEAVLRVFEREGERAKRMKARMKFLVKRMGFETFKALIEDELKGLTPKHPITYYDTEVTLPNEYEKLLETDAKDAFKLWKAQNVIAQKDGNFTIGIKLRLGDLFTTQARALIPLIKAYSGDELTLTIEQNILIRHIEEKTLETWFVHLQKLGLSEVGYLKTQDITACPGTDTCNLGIASSTGLANVLETIIQDEYADKLKNSGINIKISGCMNACGQHMLAAVGFQGMSIKAPDKRILPAAQILLGGGRLGEGKGRFADKVLKVPSKKTNDALRTLLDDFIASRQTEETPFLDYYDLKGKTYFYDLLKGFSNLENLTDEDFTDWGEDAAYVKAIGVGECAGVVVDLVSTLFFDSEEKIQAAQKTYENDQYKDSVYHTYASIVNTAKALLISEEHKTNSHAAIVAQFQEVFVDTDKIKLEVPFHELAFEFRSQELDKAYADSFLQKASAFYHQADLFRKKQLEL